MDKPAQPDYEIQGNVAMYPLPEGIKPLGMLMQNNTTEKVYCSLFCKNIRQNLLLSCVLHSEQWTQTGLTASNYCIFACTAISEMKWSQNSPIYIIHQTRLSVVFRMTNKKEFCVNNLKMDTGQRISLSWLISFIDDENGYMHSQDQMNMGNENYISANYSDSFFFLC